MAQMEVKKMKQGMSYSCKEKTIILNVFKYFRQELPELCVTEIVRRTARATGCSEKSVFQFRKEESSATGFKEPSKTKVRRYININSRDIKYDQNVRDGIRCIVYDLKCNSIVPSLNTILKHVNEDGNLPNFSLMTLRRLLFDMGFYYEKNGSKSVLLEKNDEEKNALPTTSKRLPFQESIDANHLQPLPVQSIKPALPQHQIPQQNIMPMQSIQHPIMNGHETRIMPPMLGQYPENHAVPHNANQHHSMPMMLNLQLPPPHNMPPPSVDMNVKHEGYDFSSHWMYPGVNVPKGQ